MPGMIPYGADRIAKVYPNKKIRKTAVAVAIVAGATLSVAPVASAKVHPYPGQIQKYNPNPGQIQKFRIYPGQIQLHWFPLPTPGQIQ